VLALVLGVSVLTRSADRSQEPVHSPTPTPTPTQTSVVDNPDSLRPLTYAVGGTIHFGERTIDVGDYVHSVDVTDNGVVFVRGPSTWKQPHRTGLWFTEGSSVVRIGTVEGSPTRGFPVEPSAAGTTVVWEERDGGEHGDFVVFDTEDLQVLTRVARSAASDQVLSVLDDAVYFADRNEVGCKEVVSFPVCVRDGTVVRRYDVPTGVLSRVTGASYDRDRRSRPRTIVAPLFGESGTVIRDGLVFIRHGRKLLADGGEPGAEYDVQLAQTGAPIRLRIPEGTTAADRIALTQWLDDDRVVLFALDGDGGSWLAEAGQFFTCDISNGTCRLEPRGEPGDLYQVPTRD
jgi:hypothetical protein